MSPPDVSVIAEQTSTSRPNSTNPTTMSSQQPSPGTSRRTSAAMGPPPIPHTNNSLPNSPRPPNAAMIDSTGFTGPIRHPRPLTAAELHLELEKEQESIVNRLTRELSALRTQTASVASTTSSASDLFTSQTLPEYPYASTYQGTGASIIPTSARRHRSSSNLSARSARSARDGVSNATVTSVSGVAAPRDRDASHSAGTGTNTGSGTSARQSLDIARPETSRQNSYNLSHSNSVTSNPGIYPTSSYRSTSASSPYAQSASFPHGHRPSLGSTTHSRDTSQGTGLTPSTSNQGLGIGTDSAHRSPSFSSAQAAARYEEAAVQRQELETIKKENEALKLRIKELEKALASEAHTQDTATAAAT